MKLHVRGAFNWCSFYDDWLQLQHDFCRNALDSFQHSVGPCLDACSHEQGSRQPQSSSCTSRTFEQQIDTLARTEEGVVPGKLAKKQKITHAEAPQPAPQHPASDASLPEQPASAGLQHPPSSPAAQPSPTATTLPSTEQHAAAVAAAATDWPTGSATAAAPDDQELSLQVEASDPLPACSVLATKQQYPIVRGDGCSLLEQATGTSETGTPRLPLLPADKQQHQGLVAQEQCCNGGSSSSDPDDEVWDMLLTMRGASTAR